MYTGLSLASRRCVCAQWEIFSAVDGGCEMAVTLTERESAAFIDALVRAQAVPMPRASSADHRHLTPIGRTAKRLAREAKRAD
jgi:hypothetical protein